MEARPLNIFDLGNRFRREIKSRTLYDEDFPSAEFGEKPGELRGKRTWWRRLDPFHGGGRENDKRAVLLEFAKGAAIKPQKLPEYRLRNLNFGLDLFDRNVRKSGREISEHTLERQKLLGRGSAGHVILAYHRSKPAVHHIVL